MNLVELSIRYSVGQEGQVAKELRAQLAPEGWKSLRQLAFEVTLIGESEAAGTQMVVVPAGQEAEALKSLGLRAARL